jgi:hypothetical protein
MRCLRNLHDAYAAVGVPRYYLSSSSNAIAVAPT